jgi:branched-chain amino acid transport system permease protein
MNRRSFLWLAGLGALLVLLPSFASNYVLSVATLFLYFALAGQAWNIMMGFAGQLSLGHALYLGAGAYAAAGVYFHLGIGPWAGLWLAAALCAVLGAALGALAFRYGVAGVYFTLLTIACAEFARIGLDHFAWLGGSGGLFLKIAERGDIDLANLRGAPAMFYYVILFLAAAAMALSAYLLRSRAGYYWQAIREDEDAAQALGIDTFRWKIFAITLSAAMTGIAGVFSAFYYGNLFPEQIFGIHRSVEIILAPIIGGIGTIFGPILGAALLTALAEGASEIVAALGWEVPGVRQMIYGLVLLVVIVFLPHGIWPALARKLRMEK